MAKRKAQKSQAAKNRERQLAEGLQIAKGIRDDGQSKEQTRAVARGIAKGIALYKQQQKAKMREQARTQRKRDTAQLRAEDKTAQPSTSTNTRSGAAAAFAWVGWTVLMALLVALVVDAFAARRVAVRLTTVDSAPVAKVADILPDISPLGRLRRGLLLDVSVLCSNGRLHYELAGLSFEGRAVLTNPDQMQAMASDCAVAARD